MDKKLLIELKDLITRLKEIIEREEPIQIKPIFRVPDEYLSGLEHDENF